MWFYFMLSYPRIAQGSISSSTPSIWRWHVAVSLRDLLRLLTVTLVKSFIFVVGGENNHEDVPEADRRSWFWTPPICRVFFCGRCRIGRFSPPRLVTGIFHTCNIYFRVRSTSFAILNVKGWFRTRHRCRLQVYSNSINSTRSPRRTVSNNIG